MSIETRSGHVQEMWVWAIYFCKRQVPSLNRKAVPRTNDGYPKAAIVYSIERQKNMGESLKQAYRTIVHDESVFSLRPVGKEVREPGRLEAMRWGGRVSTTGTVKVKDAEEVGSQAKPVNPRTFVLWGVSHQPVW